MTTNETLSARALLRKRFGQQEALAERVDDRIALDGVEDVQLHLAVRRARDSAPEQL